MSSSRLFIIGILLVLSIPILSSAQVDSSNHHSFRIELGGGLSSVGAGGGFNGRFAIIYLASKWGCVFRHTAHDGGEGLTNTGGFFGPSHPKEKFYDKAFLLSRIIHKGKTHRVIASSGLGIFTGERLTETKHDLIDIGSVIGFAYEFGIASAGNIFGISLLLTGNLNSETSQIGVVVSASLGN